MVHRRHVLPILETLLTNFNLISEPQPLASTPLPWGWREIVKATLFMIVATLVLSAVLAGIVFVTGRPLAESAKMSSAPVFIAVTAIYAMVVLGVYLFAVRRPGSSWGQLGFRPFDWWWAPLAPVLTTLQLMGMALINLVLVLPFTDGAFENPQIEQITGGMSLTPTDFAVLLVLIAIIAPIAEEIFFRGMLYPVMRQRWGAPVAITANALAFALLHVIPILLPGLFFVGLILAWVRERSGSIGPTILMHALQNALVLWGIYMSFSTTG